MAEGALDIDVAGESLRLLPDRALLWPRARTLVIADLHLGKAQHFRRAGIALPRGGTGHDLARLDRLLADTGAIGGDGDFGVEIFESDSADSGFGAADASVVDSNAPATLEASSMYRLGYRGHKRYVRLQLTKAGGTSIALGAVAVLEPLDKPAA